MTQAQAVRIVERFTMLGWQALARGSEFDAEEWSIDAADMEAGEFYTCRRYFSALEVLAILRARASGQPSARVDEIISGH